MSNTIDAGLEATLQKLFVLAAGRAADTQIAQAFAQQVIASGSWNSVWQIVDGYLAGQAQAMGGTALVKQMALQGLNLQLSDAQAGGFAQQIASGALSWSQLVQMVLNLGGDFGATLANKAEAAEAFTAALIAQGKGGLYFGGPQLLDGVHALLQGVTADHATVAEAQDSLEALVDHLGGTGLALKTADGYLQNATVFVDTDGDGRLDAGEQVLQSDAAGHVNVSTAAAGAGLVAVGGVDLLTGCDFEGVITAPAGATVINPLTTLVDALLRNGLVASAQAGSTAVEQEFGLPASLNLLNYDPLAVLADPLASPAAKATALDAQALALQVINVITLGGLELSAAGGVDAQQAARLMTDALAKAMAGAGALDLGDAATVQGIIASALQALTGHAPTAQQAQDAGRIAQIVAALNGEADASPSIYQLAKVACVSQCDAVDAVRGALAGSGLQDVVEHYTGQNLDNAILLTPVTGQVAPGVPVTEVVLPTQTVGIVSVADDRGTASTADDILVPRGGISGDATPIIAGNVSAPLLAGELVAVYGGADGTVLLGAAVVSGLGWTFTPDHPLSGEQQLVARVVNFYGEGPASSEYPVQFNLPPVITSNGGGASAGVSVAEGATAVTTVTATDVNGDTLTYSIAGGADAARFTIDSATGALSFVTAPDFEAPADSGADNVYDVVVQVSDGMAADTQAIAVQVTNVNEAPVITSNGGGASVSIGVAENTTLVATVAATDVDGDAITYSIVGGADAARFTIDAATGQLSFVSAPDYEHPLGGGTSNMYDVVVQASDGTLADTQELLVSVFDVNEPPAITSNGGGASATVSVAENSTAVTTVTATDQDAGSTLSYSIAGGADAGRFTIDGATGALAFVTAPDFENPLDAGANNVYDVVVQVSDGTLTDTQAIAVAVTNVNEPPVITSNGGGASAGISVAENTVAVTTVTATDVDAGTTLAYSITGGADAAKFTIDAATGALSFVTAPDYENPTDAGADNFYNVTVQASDGTLTDTQFLFVKVNNVNEAPVITSNGGGASTGVSVAENSTAVTTVAATDQDAGTTLTYSIAGGADAGKFTINATTGALSFVTAPDFESPTDAGANNVYDVTVQVSDGTLTDTQAISVSVYNVNEAPVITSNGGGASAGISVAENSTAVTTVTATDVDAGATLTYSIAGGADAGKFTIDGSTGALSFVTAPDYENPGDSGADNVYDVTVQVSDGTLADTQALSVSVYNVNDAPVITSDGGGASASVSMAEGGATVTMVQATDQDGNALSYSIAGGADAGLFTIDGSTGQLRFITAPDYENPLDSGADNGYEVTVQVSDGTLTDTQALSISVYNVNEAPVITSDGGGDSASVSIAENTTAVTTVTATDADAGTTLSYSITGGADADLFTIDAATGALAFITAPDFENPLSSSEGNTYEVQVSASDGLLSDTQTLYVSVTNVNEAPVITSDGGGASASISIGEGGATVTVVQATDVDGNTVGYSIVGGADAALFTIDAGTGQLRFLSAPDYENPLDSGADNIYDVTVQASDGTLADTQAISVSVYNVNEAPVITSNGGGASAALSVAENTTAVTTVTATDVDAGTTLTYSIAGGADAGRFTIDAATGALSFVTAPDYENPLDSGADNVYDVTVQVSDGTLTDTQALSISVTNANEAPVITSNGGGASASVSVAENTTAVTTVTATDPDAGATLTYSIVAGADMARFTIDAATGALSFITAPDFENPADGGFDNVYNVAVQVSDGTLTDVQSIAVTVTNVNEAPVITSNGAGPTAAISVVENTTAVTTVVASDPDGNGLTYSILGGVDGGLFTIDSSTGALSFITAPDFENPADAGANNVYNLTVQVSDGTLNDTQVLAITVTNTNDAPVITSNGGGATAAISVAENTTAAATVAATDQDPGTTLTYSILGGADAAKFTINSSTGALSFITAPDFENPTDAGLDNVYNLVVQVSDGTLTDTQSLAVTVTNVNEAPVITSNGGGANAAVTVAENTTAVTTVAATDVDGNALAYSIVGGADAARFTINATTGALSFLTAPNFESPGDAGANNVYDVTVQVSDGTLADTQAIAVTVSNANEAPVITSNGGGDTAAVNMAENGTAVTTVAATDPDAGTTLSYSISGGADAAFFTINATTGALSFLTAPDFENPLDAGANNVYDVTVQVSDGTLTDTQAIAVTVTNVNEAPVITSNGGGATAAVAINENTTAVTTVAATDVDGNSLTYSISGGADSAKFTINATTGALSFITAPNYEAPTDAGANNVYDVTVQVSDGTLADTQAIAVTVSNVAEAPVVLGDMLLYSAASSATSVTVPKDAFFMNDSGDTAKSTWSLTNITNTPTGGTATLSGGNISVSGFDTATTDTFTYQASDTNGTSGTATVTVQRVASSNITGTAGADIVVGSNTAGSLVGGQGNDYILGGTGNDTITGGMDADDMTGGAGADTYVFNEGTDGVGPTAVNYAGGNAGLLDNGDTFTFANGVDVIRGFTSGSDKLDFNKSGLTGSLSGADITTKLGNNGNYTVLGIYNETTHVFAVSSLGSDLLVIQGGNVAPDSFVSGENDFVILIGTTSIVGTDII